MVPARARRRHASAPRPGLRDLPRWPCQSRGGSTDTRALPPGALFVARAGEHFDAHDFLAEAVGRGASAVVVSRPERGAGLGVPVFVVRDTLAALGALAHYRRGHPHYRPPPPAHHPARPLPPLTHLHSRPAPLPRP